MSKNLSPVAITAFDSLVKQAYQGTEDNLRDAVQLRTNVKGDTYKFRTMGKGLANQKATQADVTPMDVTHAQPLATLVNYNAPEYTDIFDQAEVNFDEKAQLAKAVAMAQVRRQRQQIIDTLEGSATTNTITNDVGGTDTDLNAAKLRRASRLLNANGVPQGDRHLAHSAVALENMLGQTETTNSDYNTIKALVNGELKTFVGFKFHMIEDADEGGLTVDGSSDRTTPFWHKDAIGLAIGIDIRVDIDWVPIKTSWLTNGLYKGGAVEIDAEGVVLATTREA